MLQLASTCFSSQRPVCPFCFAKKNGPTALSFVVKPHEIKLKFNDF